MEDNKKQEFKEKEVHLTNDVIEKIAEKTKYSPSTVEQVLRGRVPVTERNRIIFDLYERIDNLRSLHRENYLKDLQEL